MYQIIVENGQFEFYEFDSLIPERDNESFKNIQMKNSKMFSLDVVDKSGTLMYSYIRSGEIIPGVLILNGNRTYGKTENGKRNLYKCIPDNRELPAFLVPYDIKLGFSKDVKNKYVVIRFEHWNDKHPRGMILETIGDVNVMDAYYEYKLYCRDIHDSIALFTSKTRELVKLYGDVVNSILQNTKYNIEDRQDVLVYSIDPDGCTDIDDAFSIQPDGDGYKVSIYIANVFVFMEELKLWDQIEYRVSTIYLPDKKRTMLPAVLSENLCSLLEKQTRIAFCMDVYLNSTGQLMSKHEFKNVSIKVHSNFAYEEPKLLANKNYQMMLGLTRKMKSDINNSHDLVEYWMIYMNSKCGEQLALIQNGIFRTATIKENTDNKMSRIIRNWNDVSCKYVVFSNTENISHQLLKADTYVHITSPIRRLVDLLNQTIFIYHMNISEISESASKFVKDWTRKIEYVNKKTKSIRKVQTDCDLMTMCYNNPDIVAAIHPGVVFDQVIDKDGMFKYSIYLHDLRTFGKIRTDLNISNYSDANFKLYYFGDEYDSKRKLKFQII
uniref:RNB domain-containing protein n=1 Tax=viral metagenome TaxID=1070528 RepID=A0A6C0F0V4_9ZZZZ